MSSRVRGAERAEGVRQSCSPAGIFGWEGSTGILVGSRLLVAAVLGTALESRA